MGVCSFLLAGPEARQSSELRTLWCVLRLPLDVLEAFSGRV